MTVQELIYQLRQLPPTQSVLVEGYEDGWDSLVLVEPGHARLREMVEGTGSGWDLLANMGHGQEPCEWWEGEFERIESAVPTSSHCVFLVGRRGHLRKAE